MARYVKVDDGPSFWLILAGIVAAFVVLGSFALLLVPVAIGAWIWNAMRNSPTRGDLLLNLAKPFVLIGALALLGALFG